MPRKKTLKKVKKRGKTTKAQARKVLHEEMEHTHKASRTGASIKPVEKSKIPEKTGKSFWSAFEKRQEPLSKTSQVRRAAKTKTSKEGSLIAKKTSVTKKPKKRSTSTKKAAQGIRNR